MKNTPAPVENNSVVVGRKVWADESGLDEPEIVIEMRSNSGVGVTGYRYDPVLKPADAALFARDGQGSLCEDEGEDSRNSNTNQDGSDCPPAVTTARRGKTAQKIAHQNSR